MSSRLKAPSGLLEEFMATFKREPLTGDEVARMNAAALSLQEKLVVWVLLDTGLRIHELCSLTADNIDWQGHQLVIWGKGSRQEKGKKKRRIVPMTDRVRPLLEGYFATQTKFAVGVRAAQLIVKRVANRAKISRPCSPHVLRHTFSVNCLKKGMTFPTLKALLGHSHLTTTFIYSNVQPEAALEEFRLKW